MQQAHSYLLVPAHCERLLGLTVLALPVAPDFTRYLLSLFDQFSSFRVINQAVHSFRVAEENALFSTSLALDVESGPFAKAFRLMRDVEANILVGAEAIEDLGGFDPVGRMYLDVFPNYIEATGFRHGDKWRTSALWSTALLHASLSIAPESERSSLFERLAELDPEFAIDVLEHGVQWNYPAKTVGPPPPVTQAAVTHLLQGRDERIRERAITLLTHMRPRPR